MPNYVLVAYKRLSEDYCKGCLMEAYPADHAVIATDDENELVNSWAKYQTCNLDLQRSEAGYDFWFFIDGVPLIDESMECWTENEKHILADSILQRVNQLAEKLHKEKQEAKQRAKEEKDHKDAEESKRQRQAQFEKLKKEFGG